MKDVFVIQERVASLAPSMQGLPGGGLVEWAMSLGGKKAQKEKRTMKYRIMRDALALIAGPNTYESLADLPEEAYNDRPRSRPTGYVSKTVFYLGGVPMAFMLDSCASVSVLPEEIALLLLSRLEAEIEAKKLKYEDRLYPIRAVERHAETGVLNGVAKDAELQVKYAMVLRWS